MHSPSTGRRGESVHAPASGEREGPVLPFSKRTLDIGCCVAALPLLFLCTIFAATLLRAVSPGPIFYRQERVGYQGRRFRLLKFRTMHVSADSATHHSHFSELVRSKATMHKLDRCGDRRLIPGGRLLRASGLDELPQVINILRGEMSVVGPRPCVPYEYVHYSSEQRRRFASVPGLTGLWQVSGKNRTTFEQMIDLDIKYGETQSLRLDLLIILLTPRAIWKQLSETRRQSPKESVNR